MAVARVLFYVFQILAVVAFGVVTISVAKAHASSDFVVKTNLAEDLRMMVDLLAGLPGDALVEIPYDASQFGILLKQDRVAVFKKGENELQWTERQFFLPEGNRAEGSAVDLQRVCLEKKAMKILLRGCEE